MEVGAVEKLFKEMMDENFPNSGKTIDPKIQEVQQTQVHVKEISLRHIIIKLLKTRDKEKILKTQPEEKDTLWTEK